MSLHARLTLFALIFVLVPETLLAEPPRAEPAVRLALYSVRRQPSAVSEITSSGDESQPQDLELCPCQSPADPYGFAVILNQLRASAGLHPLLYDPDLSAWASHNNAAQCRRGLGHHVNPSCFQNCAWNYADVVSVVQGWMNSPGHRANLLTPSATHFGIAYGPGPYWTLNAR